MARKRAPALDPVLPLVLEEAPATARLISASWPTQPALAGRAPVAAGPVAPREMRDFVVVNLASVGGTWTVHGDIIDEGGELVASFEDAGQERDTGLAHAGWVEAACAALRRCLALNKPLQVEVRIPEPAPVGFLVVTIPGRIQRASWDEQVRAKPWPEIYQTFADLAAQVHPRIRWVP